MKKYLFGVLIACTQIFCTTIFPPQVTAAYDSRKNAVVVKWTNHEPEVKAFAIQRSDNERNWVDIGYMQLAATGMNKDYIYVDDKPLPGNNYYRLKVITNTTILFANAVLVTTGQQGNNNWVMYPVPVTTMLNLQYKGTAMLKGVVNVIIQMMNGRIITRYRGASLNRSIQIPVDNLGKGIYDVRIVIEDEIVWNQRFVK